MNEEYRSIIMNKSQMKRKLPMMMKVTIAIAHVINSCFISTMLAKLYVKYSTTPSMNAKITKYNKLITAKPSP
jgi:hypothetical protein